MSKSRASTSKATKEDTFLLEKLPSRIPFVPIVRRPDYQLRQVKLKLPTSIPIQLIIVVIFLGLFFIFIGGFYNLAQDPVPAFGQDPEGNPVVILKQLNHQYLVEGIAAGFLMFIGAGGFFLIHYSTQYAYSPKNATLLLLMGMLLVSLCWIGISFMLRAKIQN